MTSAVSGRSNVLIALVAADVVARQASTQRLPARNSISESRTILSGDYLGGQYDVSPDGSQFLMLKPAGAQQQRSSCTTGGGSCAKRSRRLGSDMGGKNL